MAEYADARRAELERLCAQVSLPETGTLQAAGGFVTDAIAARSGGRIHCVCVEPSAALSARLAPQHTIYADEIDDLASDADASIDVVLGLAGLHHSRSAARTLAEVFRVLVPGGQFGLCDVAPESPVARCCARPATSTSGRASSRYRGTLIATPTCCAFVPGCSDCNAMTRRLRTASQGISTSLAAPAE